MATNSKLYKVSFTFDDSYTPKSEGWRTISLVVSADTQFRALDVAWAKLTSLDLPEPQDFSASRIDKS